MANIYNPVKSSKISSIFYICPYSQTTTDIIDKKYKSKVLTIINKKASKYLHTTLGGGLGYLTKYEKEHCFVLLSVYRLR